MNHGTIFLLSLILSCLNNLVKDTLKKESLLRRFKLIFDNAKSAHQAKQLENFSDESISNVCTIGPTPRQAPSGPDCL
jgi:hypothetical protein